MSVFHIVCHSCDAENVVESEQLAVALRRLHAEEYTDHDVEYDQISE